MVTAASGQNTPYRPHYTSVPLTNPVSSFPLRAAFTSSKPAIVISQDRIPFLLASSPILVDIAVTGIDVVPESFDSQSQMKIGKNQKRKSK